MFKIISAKFSNVKQSLHIKRGISKIFSINKIAPAYISCTDFSLTSLKVLLKQHNVFNTFNRVKTFMKAFLKGFNSG